MQKIVLLVFCRIVFAPNIQAPAAEHSMGVGGAGGRNAFVARCSDSLPELVSNPQPTTINIHHGELALYEICSLLRVPCRTDPYWNAGRNVSSHFIPHHSSMRGPTGVPRGFQCLIEFCDDVYLQ